MTSFGCILSKFYIKPQLSAISFLQAFCCILSKFYIKPQLCAGCPWSASVVSYRNSTSNHNRQILINKTKKLYLIEILHQTTTGYEYMEGLWGCILSKFYIKPQHFLNSEFDTARCILSKFYIKPQRVPAGAVCPRVVSYRNSTSNHNFVSLVHCAAAVVSYRNSTSNHNNVAAGFVPAWLYLIEILHQTTTAHSS